MEKTLMGFELPEVPEGTSEEARIAIHAAALSGRLAVEKRTIVWNTDGQQEDVAQHSHMIGLVAYTLAAELEPGLNAERVSALSLIHDAVEAYVGDTPTHIISNDELQQKRAREAAGLERLRSDYDRIPPLLSLVVEYEAQQTPESRFVRLIDKTGPVLTYIIDHGMHAAQDGITPQDLRGYWQRKENALRLEYPEFERYIRMGAELVEAAAVQLATLQK